MLRKWGNLVVILTSFWFLFGFELTLCAFMSSAISTNFSSFTVLVSIFLNFELIPMLALSLMDEFNSFFMHSYYFCI